MTEELYPVWYLEARPSGAAAAAPRLGSAVVVRIRKRGDASPGRKVLLTCGHVVRGRAADGEDGWGPVLDDLLVWPPGKGFTRAGEAARRPDGSIEGAMKAKVWDGWGTGSNEVLQGYRSPAADWIVLEVTDPLFQDQPCVAFWSPPGRSGLSVVGYPAGSQLWKEGDLVEPAIAGEFKRQGVEPGIVRTTGSETRPGMSGGGLFGADGGFVGLHRSRVDAGIKQHAIAATYLQEQLSALGWEVVQTGAPRPKWVRFAIAGVVTAVVATVAFVAVPRPPVHTTLAATVSELVYDEDGNIEATRPLTGARVGLLFKNADQREVRSELVGANGDTKLEFELARAELRKQLGLYFSIDSVPESRKADAPFITTTWAALRQGDGTTTFRDAYPLPAGGLTDPIALTVVPLAQKNKFYLTDALSAGLLRRGASDDFAKDFDAAAKDLGLTDEADVAKVKADWAARMLKRTPVIAIASEAQLKVAAPDVKKVASDAGPSVCHVTLKGNPAARRTGFVIGDDLVVTAHLAATDSYESVAFGAKAGEGPKLAVVSVLPRPQLNVAILTVRGLAAPPLRVFSLVPHATQNPRKVAVVGYAGVDARSPKVIQEVQRKDGADQRRILPGSLLPFDARDEELHHDAWTSPGSDGGPVLDLASAGVLGVQLRARWDGAAKKNTAVPMWRVLADPEVERLVKTKVKPVPVPRMLMVRALTLDRPGYASDFLRGVSIPMPRAADATRLLLQNSKSEFPSEHLTLLLDRERELALCAAANFDRSQGKALAEPEVRAFPDRRAPEFGRRHAAIYQDAKWVQGPLMWPKALAWGTQVEAEEGHEQAFAAPNTVPQLRGFRKAWLEVGERVLKQLHPEAARVSVFCGPVLAKADLKLRGIPRELWVVAIYENSREPAKPALHAWIFRHFDVTSDDVPVPSRIASLQEHEVSLDEVEKRSGLLFGNVPGRR